MLSPLSTARTFALVFAAAACQADSGAPPARGGAARVVAVPSSNAPPAGGGQEAPIDNPALARDEGERRVLEVIAEMEADPERRYLSISHEDGRLLRQLAEAAGAARAVEIGTSTGYSGLWLALALRATGGELVTHEIDPGRAEIARKNFEKAGVAELVTIVVGDAHETVQRLEGPIDVLFLDADKPGYVDYLEKLMAKIRPGGLILAHNMRRPAPDPRFLEAITADPALDTSFLLMEGAGMGVTLKKR